MVLITIATLTGCGGEPITNRPDNSSRPLRGGTLRIVGSNDVDHLSTTSAGANSTYWLFRAFTRQLVSYAASANFKTATEVAPDLADRLPTKENEGISEDGLTYTIHLKRGVRWNTTPPRDVVGSDVMRGFKLLCNPVIPGLSNYYEAILGMTAFCDEFGHVPATVRDIKQFIETHDIDGLRVPDDGTIVFVLKHPAADFLNLLADPYATPVPVEYLNYVPDGPEFRQHTISDGPYQIVKYAQGREFLLERNPVWDAATDPLRPAYVDRIEIHLGMDTQLIQLQIEAGLADLSLDQQPSVTEIASLLELGSNNLVLAPPGRDFGLFNYLVVNMVSPNAEAALKKLQVRKALELAIDKTAIVQDWGGPQMGQPSRQAAINTTSGYRPGADSYVTSADTGDPAQARRLLAEAGYSNGISLKLAYPLLAPSPLDAQRIQASLGRAGIDVQLIPLTLSSFLSLGGDETVRGAWDLALIWFIPDWFGSNNGRSSIGLLFEGKSLANHGRYNNDDVEAWINRGLEASNADDAKNAWDQAAARVMNDAAIVPLIEAKYAWLHSTRVHDCVFDVTISNCNINSLWLDNR